MNAFLFNLINSNRSSFLDIVSTIISSYLFIGIVIFGILLFVLLSPRIIHKTRTLILIILTVLINLVLVDIFSKNLIFVPRPYVVLKNAHMLGVIKTDSTIPSSHVSLISSILFALVLSNPFLWPSLFFILVMGWSRIYNGMHWPGDVLLGIMAGFVSAWIAILALKPIHFPGILERKE